MPRSHALLGTAAVVGLLGATLLAAACGGDGDGEPGGGPSSESPTSTGGTPSTSTAPSGPLEVEVRSETFVDATRPTPDGEGGDLSADRTLRTDLYLPRGEGPFPLIVFAHGRSGHPSRLRGLLTAWAEAGFVVAAPAFPATNDQAPLLVVGDYNQQPADLSFLVDELLRSAEPGGALAGLIDGERVGAAGHSLGGGTVWGLTFNTCCRDERVDAVIVLSALQFPFDGEFLTSGPPLLLVHGTDDASLPYDKGVEPYAAITTPRMLLTLVGGTHSEPVEDDPSPHDEILRTVTRDWWVAQLYGDTAAKERLAESAAVEGLTTAELDL